MDSKGAVLLLAVALPDKFKHQRDLWFNQKEDVTREWVLVQVKKSRDFAPTTQNTTKIHTCYTENDWEWHDK